MLYKDIKLNYSLLDIWKKLFIPFSITNNIIYCNCNHYKYASFAANLCNSNFEKNFNTAIADTKKRKNYIYSGYVYNDINNRWENLTLKLLSTIKKIKVIVLALNTLTAIVILYCNKKSFMLVNN